ncbi:MAG: LytTR family DNA-binding domain-containing protein [Flavobacteriales bacterium]|nr:LytTR family DNA-binding domain-containing protein [Flavobacteriales bacterium]
MRILVIEDDLSYRGFIVNEVLKIIPNAEMLEASSVDQARKLIEKNNPNLILSDIELEDNRISFEIFENLEKPLEGKVIFISSHDTFAMRAIKMSACDYILKPIDLDEFRVIISKAKEEIILEHQNEKLNLLLSNFSSPDVKKILVSDRKETIVMDLADIAFFESDGQYTKIVFNDIKRDDFTSSMPIRHFEEMISDDFYRCHRSYIVNLNSVNSFSFTNSIKLKNGRTIKLAKLKRGDFKDRLKYFMSK